MPPARLPKEHSSTELDSFGISEGSVQLPSVDDLLPHKAQVIAGEIIHDLRSALDNLIYEVSRRVGEPTEYLEQCPPRLVPAQSSQMY